MAELSGSSQNSFLCHWCKHCRCNLLERGECWAQNEGYCIIFRWTDPPLCERSRHIIRGLLRRLNEKIVEYRKLQNVNLKLEEMICIIETENDLLVEEQKKDGYEDQRDRVYVYLQKVAESTLSLEDGWG